MGSEQSTEIKTEPIIKTEEIDDCSSYEGMRTFPSKNKQRIVNTEETDGCSNSEGIGEFQSGSRPEGFEEEYQVVRETEWLNKKVKDEITECSSDHCVMVRKQQEMLKEQWQELRKQQEKLKNEQKEFKKKKRAIRNQRGSKKRQRQIQNFQDPFTRAEITSYKDWEFERFNNGSCAPAAHCFDKEKLTKCSNCESFENAGIMIICVSCTRNVHRVDVLSPRFPEANVPLEEFVICSKCAPKEHPDNYVHLRMNYSFLAQKHAPILNEEREEQKPIVENVENRKIDDEQVVEEEEPVPLKIPKVEPEI